MQYLTNTAPPQGQVTLMFTDVEGSTSGWERFQAQFGDALVIHDRLVSEAIATHRGYQVKTAGDSFMVAFSDPLDAVRCAIDIQARLAERIEDPAWRLVSGIRVRIGIHTGEPTFRDGDYFGPPVNRANRICDAGHGGMILISQMTAALIREQADGVAILRDRGPHRLKDLGQPEPLFEVCTTRSKDAGRPLRTLEALQHNFPAQVTSLVGRLREMEDLARLLQRPDTRLITLTGPAGTGKTRLALQVAANLVQRFPGGVWLVELAPVQDSSGVVSAIAMALQIDLTPSADPLDQVAGFLRTRQSMLVLDNFEHVADAAPSISKLLQACPSLTCLVTSRELLHLSHEREYVVEPLTLPSQGATPGQWAQCESVQLFVERCQAARPDFELNSDNGPGIGEICRRLDGIPLAIELAAARVRGMTIHQILQRLTRRFELLSSGHRDLPERQRTLRSAIDWSYELLHEDERALYCELAVFAGGCTVDAAEQVCRTPGVLDLLFSLRDKSLLKTTEAGGETRYLMLETLREYAREKLQQTNSLSDLSERHAAYYLGLARDWWQKLRFPGPEAASIMALFKQDIDNIRAGMDWAAQAGRSDMVIEYGQALFVFLDRCGLCAECDTRLLLAEEAARQTGDLKAVARLLNQRGLVALHRSDLAAAHPLLRESYRISKELSDRERMLFTLVNLGFASWGASDYPQARVEWEEALSVAVEIGEARVEAVAREHLGILAWLEGRYEEAGAYFATSLEMHRRNGNQEGIASCLLNSAELFLKLHDCDTALERVEESSRIYTALGHTHGMALAAGSVGKVLLERGSAEAACLHAQQGLRLAHETGDRHPEMYALLTLARIHTAMCRFSEAYPLFLKSSAIGRAVGDQKHIADVVRGFGEMLRTANRPCDAYRLLASAQRAYERLGVVDASEVAPAVQELRGSCGETSDAEIPAEISSIDLEAFGAMPAAGGASAGP